MLENPLKRRFAEGGGVLNGWLHLPSTVSAEVMAKAGFDALTLDLQHGLIGYESALPMLQVLSASPVVPLARVPWNEPGLIMKLLDAGAYGIICPMVNSREEAERFVGACRYPPHGYRSYGPTRVRYAAGATYAEHANSLVLTIAMIETKEALENLEAILSTPGLDAIYVGPADLSQSFGGKPGVDFRDGPVRAALEGMLEAAARHGIAAGIHNATNRYAQEMLELGFHFVTVGSDLLYLAQGASEVVAAFKSGAEALPPRPY